jgi:hydrogenase maturation protease
MTHESGEPGPTLIVGLGNPILTDDGVGPLIADELRRRLAGRPDVAIVVDTHGGLRLMERLMGHRRAIVVDAMVSGAPAGTLFDLGPNDFPTAHSGSTHDATLPGALWVGRELGAVLPADEDLRLVGIEAEDIHTFGESCSEAVLAAVPRAVDHVIELVERIPDWGEPLGRLPDPDMAGKS